MFPLAKILLPVDFSERSCGAARYAEALAKHFDSQVVLLHALPPPHYEFSALEVGGAVLNELFASRAAQMRQELSSFLCDELKHARVERVLLEGDPARKIVEYAHTAGVNLLMMPTHGHGPFRRFILGSVTAKVLHDADCPVWTGVHLEEAPAVESIKFKNIVAGVDLAEHSARTLTWAARLAEEYGARLTLVHATPSVQSIAVDSGDADWQARLNAQASEELAKLQASAGTNVEVEIAPGDPPRVVCAAAERHHADLLVIGRGSASGIFGRLRTNAYAIIRQSPCPVVSV